MDTGPAELPGTIRTAHPRLLATQADLDRIRQEAAIGPLSLPPSKGKIVFQLTPRSPGPNDIADADVFGQQKGKGNRLYLRYSGAVGAAGTVSLQAAFEADGKTGGKNVFLKLNEPNDITFEWDIPNRTALLTAKYGDTVSSISLGWTSQADFDLVNRQLTFFGREGDLMTDATLYDNNQPVWHSKKVDLELHRSWRGFLANAVTAADKLNACEITDDVSIGDSGGCDRNQNGRAMIVETAQRLVVAYRMTGRPGFLDAANKHIGFMLRLIDSTKNELRTKGGEWDMAARVAALGLYYDWLHTELQQAGRLPALAKAIKDNIATKNSAKTNDDLVYSICGWNQTVVATTARLACEYEPTLTIEDGMRRSIADSYISGHPQGANALVAMGLLAIGGKDDGNADVQPMLRTIYRHFTAGFWRARDYYSVDGGNHGLFAYSASGGNDTAERLVMWRRALGLADLEPLDPNKPEPANAPRVEALPQLIYPYIYALRGDGTYPARGDYFRVDAGTPGEMAAAAVASAHDGYPAYFYDNYVLPSRNKKDPISRMDSGRFWERLLYPAPTVERTEPAGLLLSRHFHNAGNVIMRDTWKYAEATLLEFKSSSYITLNHHHMDQNSFSLFYKTPLLLDSGHYDKYGSRHWHNYYIRSIAHNTIVAYDPDETYSVAKETDLANDGGQWPGARDSDPQLHDIQQNGKNVLAGVVTYKEGGNYAYVTGNASKAYINRSATYPGNKLDAEAGFLRSMVYLRPTLRGDKPKILVFDSVRPVKDNLAIASILHSVNEPSTTVAPVRETAGRYRFNFENDSPAPLTIVNGDGMVTVQPLLPAKASVLISGGKGREQCDQAPDTNKKKETIDNYDCRFLVRTSGKKGAVRWENQATLEKADDANVQPDSPTTDTGGWRIEIAPKVAPRKGETQYFLNVLHVDDAGSRSSNAAAATASLQSTNGNAVAVKMADGRLIVFHDGTPTAAGISWTIDPKAAQHTLVVGLRKDARYTLETKDATRKLVLSATGALQAHDGVIEIDKDGNIMP